MNHALSSAVVLLAFIASSVVAETPSDPVPLKDWPVAFEQIRRQTIPSHPLTAANRSLTAAPHATVPSAATHFVTMVPCRIVDTRDPNGPYGGPILSGNRTFNVPAGPCAGIPSAASAYSFAVSVTQTSGAGHVIAWPTGQTKPVAATMAWGTAGLTLTVGAVVPAGFDGVIDVFSPNETHLIIDINGYFVEGVVTTLSTSDGLTGGGTGRVTVGIADGGISDAKLGTITIPGKVANSATTATSANVANTVVSRDESGAFAAGALTLSGKIDQTSDEGFVAKGTTNQGGSIPATGSGTRLMWAPARAAFRAGHVSEGEWNDASIGYFSMATGHSTTASGQSSTAMGRATVASGPHSTALGLRSSASGTASTATGGNTIASGNFSTATGSSTTASGFASVATGANTSATGHYSTAMGRAASASGHDGSFVYGDSSTTAVLSATAANQFLVRASGGVTFFSNAAMDAGVTLSPGGGAWASASDRGLKTDFQPIDRRDILDRLARLPLTSWRYKNGHPERRYIGPVAQDFQAAFGLGDEKTIATMDVDGVTLAAMQALAARTADLEKQNAALREQIARLAEAFEQLKRDVTSK